VCSPKKSRRSSTSPSGLSNAAAFDVKKRYNHVQIDGVYVLDKEGSLTEMATFGVGFMKQELGLMPF
jgi:hypothetical protein